MIAASARLVQISIDLTATLMSGVGGTTEKPIRYERVPSDDIFGSGADRGHAVVTTTTKEVATAQLRGLIITREYDPERQQMGHAQMAGYRPDETLLVSTWFVAYAEYPHYRILQWN
jgi:hypothetical protein